MYPPLNFTLLLSIIWTLPRPQRFHGYAVSLRLDDFNNFKGRLSGTVEIRKFGCLVVMETTLPPMKPLQILV